MNSRLIVLPEAVDDAVEAFRWYELRSPGLGERFLSQVDDCINQICRQPELFELVYKLYRRAIVRDFPYVIFYTSRDDTVIIASIFHSAQNPKKWRKRLKGLSPRPLP